jgi:DNA-binding XRE family transcriptional regulator
MGSRRARQYYCRCGTHLAKDNTERQCARCQRASRDKLITPPEVPAEFWQTEQFREAFAAQHIGRVFRAYRTHPHHYAVYGPEGISQTLLGQWLGLRQPQVSRIETGPPIPHLDTLQHWARVLRIPAELLWFRLPEDKGQLAMKEPVGSDLGAGISASRQAA